MAFKCSDETPTLDCNFAMEDDSTAEHAMAHGDLAPSLDAFNTISFTARAPEGVADPCSSLCRSDFCQFWLYAYREGPQRMSARGVVALAIDNGLMCEIFDVPPGFFQGGYVETSYASNVERFFPALWTKHAHNVDVFIRK